MKSHFSILSSHRLYFCVFYYLILTGQAVVSQTENPNAKSVPPPEGPKHMVRPDEVKSVIDQHNSIIHKLTDNGISTIDSLQNAATSTVYNLSWYATSLLSNTLKILSNTMQTAKDVGVNTLSAGVRVGMNTMRMADGVVRGALSLAKIGTHGVGNQLSSASGFFKNVSQHPDALNMSQVRVTPNISSLYPSSLSSIIPASSDVVHYVYDTNTDSFKAVYNSTIASAGSVGWLVTDTLADTAKILENTVELVENLKDTTINTGYKLGENGVELTETLVGGGYNLVEDGLSSVGNQMEGLSKALKDRVSPQRLVDVQLPDGNRTA
ncbi:hypothetical protein M8J77_017679 [Diaphorina citri]|nr:hypothetical protein M8J77_017679 [Diaphorina citri]